MDTITNELGDILMMETVPGLSGASSLNDISIVTINKENFDTNPETRGWLLGSQWTWDAINQRLKII